MKIQQRLPIQLRIRVKRFCDLIRDNNVYRDTLNKIITLLLCTDLLIKTDTTVPTSVIKGKKFIISVGKTIRARELKNLKTVFFFTNLCSLRHKAPGFTSVTVLWR